MTPKKILVVDDERCVRNLVGLTLRNRGHVVIEAQDAEEARRMMEQEAPDCIVLDAMLPGMTGFDLCAELKDDPKTRDVFVVMLSGITAGMGPCEEHWREKSHADDYIAKPFRLADLVTRVEGILGGSRAVA